MVLVREMNEDVAAVAYLTIYQGFLGRNGSSCYAKLTVIRSYIKIVLSYPSRGTIFYFLRVVRAYFVSDLIESLTESMIQA